MNIQFETPNTPTEGILRIAIEQADIQPRLDKKLKELGQKVTLKGFRPGKVPAQMLKKMFGQDVLAQELNGFLNDTINDYFDSNKQISLLGSPMPIADEEEVDFKKGSAFKFAFRCGVVPAFQYDLSQLYVKDYEVIVDDETINKVTKDLQREHGQFGPTELVSKDDIIKGVLYDTQHDYSIEENRPKQDEIDEDEFDDFEEVAEDGTIKASDETNVTKFYQETFLPLDAVNETEAGNFFNASVGTIVHFDIKSLMKDQEKGLRLLTGKDQEVLDKLEGEFAFEIKEIMHNALAELNEEFYEKVFPGKEIKTEEGFRAALKEDTLKYYESKNAELKKIQIREQLVENTAIDLPHEFLKEFFVKRRKNTTPEDIEKEYPDIEKGVRWEVLSNKLNEEKFDFKIEDKEVRSAAINSLLSMYGQYGQSQEIFNYIMQIAEDYTKKNYTALVQDVLTNKLLEAIAEDVTPAKQIVSEEEFMEIYNHA